MSTSKQDYDANEASSSYEQRGVEKYGGAGDHDGKRWHACKDQIKSAAMVLAYSSMVVLVLTVVSLQVSVLTRKMLSRSTIVLR